MRRRVSMTDEQVHEDAFESTGIILLKHSVDFKEKGEFNEEEFEYDG